MISRFSRLIRGNSAGGEQVDPLATRRSLQQAYEHLRAIGFEPATIIDVGVADGTPEIYETFPGAYYLLVEPLKEFEDYMQRTLQRLQGEYVLAAAGAEDGELEINVHDGHLNGSSLYKESMGSQADGHPRTVPIVRLDDLVAQRQLSGPMMLKIDVQGAELDVLDGAPDTLTKVDAVVLEVSMFQFMSGGPQFYEVIHYMKQRGLVAYDIILGWNRPLDNALGQVDIIFVQDDGRFRQDHSYSTVEQLSEVLNN